MRAKQSPRRRTEQWSLRVLPIPDNPRQSQTMPNSSKQSQTIPDSPKQSQAIRNPPSEFQTNRHQQKTIPNSPEESVSCTEQKAITPELSQHAVCATAIPQEGVHPNEKGASARPQNLSQKEPPSEQNPWKFTNTFEYSGPVRTRNAVYMQNCVLRFSETHRSIQKNVPILSVRVGQSSFFSTKCSEYLVLGWKDSMIYQ